ncbi:GNAT family N-acetyltransferase [Virgibacillus sp. 179-BFC.A HS]|uniref:GNAT family N-acetyltransferase n=1 Tax=Tigheibacillus jepli TaxID=3035914 RepID=A0ABU5CLZ9_9BACI|nr:GNAT family N-acetyltransferase [Virgibacillus sp. 179-BFC.A HS]MDY0406931.1 GNAT family N-acetyltransferase [Virgibacillus sp. 179-BFC.A HS]
MQWYVKTFQELTNDELYDLLKARFDVFVMEQDCIYPELDNYDQDAIHIFLKIGGQVAANVRVLQSGSRYPEASIGRVLVTKEFRKYGYGREIMKKAIAYIEEKLGDEKIKIQAQAYLHDFYGSLGFRQISEPYMDDGILHIDMLRDKNNMSLSS